jgi:hypothetical protein
LRRKKKKIKGDYLGESNGDSGLHGQLIREVQKLLLLFLNCLQQVAHFSLGQ